MIRNIKRKALVLAAGVTLVAGITACDDQPDGTHTPRWHCEQATNLYQGYYPNAVFEPSTIQSVNNIGTLNDHDDCLIYAGPNQAHPWVYQNTFYNDGDRVVFNPA